MNLVPWKKTSPAPATLTPYFPFSDTQRMFDRMWGLSGFPAFAGDGVTSFPAINVSDQEDTLLVKAEVPGMDADDLQISVEGNILTLRGEKREEKLAENENLYQVERSFGTFTRRIELPNTIDSNKATASIERGILTLKLPKISCELVKTIKVQTGRAAS